ncbi:hypothetical protein OIO90_001878 [Microbotryomycetes sp. JL221]|nr:hypothetical protein OIO90_001878 [Microbotryomycetes sp. JL221]
MPTTNSTHSRNLAPYRPQSDTLSFAPRSKAQPLYRPASLRRSSPAPTRSSAAATSGSVAAAATPPLSSPALTHEPKHAATSSTSSWLPWSTQESFSSSATASGASLTYTTVTPLGSMVPRSHWRPDEEALICSDPNCTERFSLLVRKHHCRRCGEVFCSSHSGRSAPLWPNMEDANNGLTSLPVTPGATPRPSPRSSHVDIPSLAHSNTNPTSPGSSAISVASSSGSTNSSVAATAAIGSGHTTPPIRSNSNTMSSLLLSLGQPQIVRVCDSCFFSAPTPPLQTPPLSAAASAFAFAARPVTLRHPRSGQSTPSLSTSPSFSQSPPRNRRRQRSREPSSVGLPRSRQNSTTTTDSNSMPSTSSTPPTSLEQNDFSGVGAQQQSMMGLQTRRSYSSVAARAVSPCSSSSRLRFNAIVTVPTTTTTSAARDGDTLTKLSILNLDEAQRCLENGMTPTGDQDRELDSDEEQALADEEARQRKLRRKRRQQGLLQGHVEEEEQGLDAEDNLYDDDDDDDDEEGDVYDEEEQDEVEVISDLVEARAATRVRARPLVKTKFGSVQQGWQNWATF